MHRHGEVDPHPDKHARTCTAKSHMMHALRASSHHASKKSRLAPLCREQHSRIQCFREGEQGLHLTAAPAARLLSVQKLQLAYQWTD